MVSGFILIFVLFPHAAQAQNLDGVVRSVTYFPTCEISGLKQAGPGNPCDRLGGDLSSVVAVRAKISPMRVNGGNTLVFKLNSLPPPLSEFKDDAGQLTQPFDSNSPDAICASQDAGQNCTFFQDQLDITFASSDMSVVYGMARDADPVPYAYFWHQCQTPVQTPSGPAGAQFAWTQSASCSSITTPSSNSKTSREFQSCMTKVQPNAGQIFSSGQNSVCPTSYPSQDNNFDASAIYVAPEYGGFSDQCTAIMCPAVNGSTYVWDVGAITTAGPECWLWRLNPRARPLLNAEIIATKPGVTGSPAATVRLSSFQDGALQVGGFDDAPIMANVISVESASSIVADDLQGAILTCGTCSPDQHGVSDYCRYGMVSDYSATNQVPSDDNDLFLQMGKNPWRANLGRLTGICDGEVCASTTVCNNVVCTVPTRACRQCLFQDPEVKTLWMYIDQQMLDTQWTGGGCNSNGMPQTVFASRPDLAAYACATGLNGTCVPGYQQFGQGGVRPGTTTPCQIQFSWTQLLERQSTTGDSVNYGLGMPHDFNAADPQYWVVGPFLMRDAKYGTGDQTGLDFVFYLPAAYYGETVSLANGVFASAGMLCSVVSQSTTSTGIISYYVSNTGASVGTYCVDVSFIIPQTDGSEQYTVTNLTQPSCFQVPAGLTVQGPSIEGWGYAGPQTKGLKAKLYLRADVQLAYYPDGVTLAVADLSCDTLAPSNIVSTFNGSDIGNVINDLYGQDADDYVCNWYGPDLSEVPLQYYCQYWQLFYCFQGRTWTWCAAAFILRGFFVLLLLALVLWAIFAATGCLYALSAKSSEREARQLQVENDQLDKDAAAQQRMEHENMQRQLHEAMMAEQARQAQETSLLGTAAKVAAVGAL